MTAKLIVAIVAALGLGFTGTYFATSGSSHCDGGCPIHNLLFGSDAKCEAKSDCCSPASDCCSPKQKCCTEATAKVAKAAACEHGCCFAGSPCCAEPEKCPHGCCGVAADCCATVKADAKK